MTNPAIDQEPLLDAEFAMSLWGDDAMFQRLLRLSIRSLATIPDPATVPSLQGEALVEAGKALHKYAGRSGVVGLNRLASALRAVDHAVRAGEPCLDPAQQLVTVLADTRKAVADYLAVSEVPFVAAVEPANVDCLALRSLIDVFQRAVEGDAGTSELDDAMETLFDVVGEEPAFGVHDAINASDMELMATAISDLKTRYSNC